MKKMVQVKAWFFLSVIIFMTLINALPHLHHNHQEAARDNSETHHHHGDADHHHPSPEKSPEVSFDFSLDFLLQNHLHAVHSHEFVQFVKRNTRIDLKKQLVAHVIFNTQTLRCKQYVTLNKTVNDLQNSYYKTPLIVNTPLRGPPQLG